MAFEVPKSANSNGPPQPQMPQIDPRYLWMAAAHMESMGRLGPNPPQSENIIDLRDPNRGVGGKTPDVSVHSTTEMVTDIQRGKLNRLKASREESMRRGTETIDDHDIAAQGLSTTPDDAVMDRNILEALKLQERLQSFQPRPMKTLPR